MIDTELSGADPQERVCPECGAPGPSGSFCSNCGLNLSAVERLPTREEWQHAKAAPAATARPAPLTQASAHRQPREAVRNPAVAVGAWVALVGAALILVGTFLPIRKLGILPIPDNSFVSDGDWWLLLVALVVAVAALYFHMGAGRGRGWQVIVPGLAAAAGGIYALTNKFQHLPLTSLGQQLLNESSAKTTPGVGVYLVLAGAVISVIGGVMLFRATGEES